MSDALSLQLGGLAGLAMVKSAGVEKAPILKRVTQPIQKAIVNFFGKGGTPKNFKFSNAAKEIAKIKAKHPGISTKDALMQIPQVKAQLAKVVAEAGGKGVKLTQAEALAVVRQGGLAKVAPGIYGAGRNIKQVASNVAGTSGVTATSGLPLGARKALGVLRDTGSIAGQGAMLAPKAVKWLAKNPGVGGLTLGAGVLGGGALYFGGKQVEAANIKAFNEAAKAAEEGNHEPWKAFMSKLHEDSLREEKPYDNSMLHGGAGIAGAGIGALLGSSLGGGWGAGLGGLAGGALGYFGAKHLMPNQTLEQAQAINDARLQKTLETAVSPTAPKVVQDATTNLLTVDPGTADPAVPDPAVPDPAVPDPAVPDPAVPDPAVPDPAVPDPAAPHPAIQILPAPGTSPVTNPADAVDQLPATTPPTIPDPADLIDPLKVEPVTS